MKDKIVALAKDVLDHIKAFPAKVLNALGKVIAKLADLIIKLANKI